MQTETYQRGTDVRQNPVIDVLLIIIFSLSLLICGKVSADTGWQSGGDFQGTVKFGGTITPYDDSLPPWLWKTGGYTGFSNKISELTGNGTRLTVSAPRDLLLLAGKSERAFEGSKTSGAGIVPVIQLKGSDGSEIRIQWASGTPGQGLLVLPLSVTGDTQTTGTLAAEVQAFGALSTWHTADGLSFISRMTEGEVSAESIWAQLRQIIPGHMHSGYLPVPLLIFISAIR